MSFNRVTLLGNLGTDPDIRVVGEGKSLCKFTLATHRLSKGARVADWHSVVSFGQVALNCSKFLRKGNKVLVEGSLQTSSYRDEKGTEKRAYEIVANRVVFLDRPQEGVERSDERKIKEPLQPLGDDFYGEEDEFQF